MNRTIIGEEADSVFEYSDPLLVIYEYLLNIDQCMSDYRRGLG
jgi:hypothetical protein